MSEFQAIAQVGEVADPGTKCIEIQDRFIVLVHLNGEYYCLDDVCTHDGGTLGEGALEENCLVCPRHGARFDVKSGLAIKMPATEPTLVHQVRIEGNQILVKLSD